MATFKEAFASARKAGKKVFSWNGKKYTTELAKGTGSSPRPKARPAAEDTRGGGKQYSPTEAMAKKAAEKAKPSEQAPTSSPRPKTRGTEALKVGNRGKGKKFSPTEAILRGVLKKGS